MVLLGLVLEWEAYQTAPMIGTLYLCIAGLLQSLVWRDSRRSFHTISRLYTGPFSFPVGAVGNSGRFFSLTAGFPNLLNSTAWF